MVASLPSLSLQRPFFKCYYIRIKVLVNMSQPHGSISNSIKSPDVYFSMFLALLVIWTSFQNYLFLCIISAPLEAQAEWAFSDVAGVSSTEPMERMATIQIAVNLNIIQNNTLSFLIPYFSLIPNFPDYCQQLIFSPT